MKIGPFDFSQKVLIIAEVGNNHEGRIDIAKELVRQAADCGVHAIKFQTYRTKFFVNQSDNVRYNRLKSFELSQPQFADLADLAHSLGLLFISTPLDIESARFLLQIVDAIKIASGDNNFYPLIREVTQSEKPLIVSTGVSEYQQIVNTYQFIKELRNGRDLNLSFLHCISSYPTPLDQVNLRSIPYLRDKLDIPIGYSDHTCGIDAVVAAVALGAQIIEKHFTLDKAFSDFRDHQLSSDPSEMKLLVEKINLLEPMLGNYDKKIQLCESSAAPLIRRSIVAGRDLSVGHRVDYNDLTWIRPAVGLPPGEEQKLIGRILKHEIQFGQIINESDTDY